MPDYTKKVSVIVTTRNEEANIENCLKSITGQTYPQNLIEIIVVDNNSADRTKETAAHFTDKVFDFGPERSAQRNFGLRKATGDYLLYLDCDMSLSKGVIAEAVSKCVAGSFAALYIPEKVKGEGFWAKVRDFERGFYNATPIDCVRFIRRDKFLEAGDFDESLTGPEDWDFDRRVRQAGKVAIIDSPIFHDESRFNLKGYLNKKIYYAGWLDKYIRKWGKDDPIVKKQLGFWYRYFGVFIENNKWIRLFLHPLLSTGMYFLKVCVGLQYLKHRWAALKKAS